MRTLPIKLQPNYDKLNYSFFRLKINGRKVLLLYVSLNVRWIKKMQKYFIPFLHFLTQDKLVNIVMQYYQGYKGISQWKINYWSTLIRITKVLLLRNDILGGKAWTVTFEQNNYWTVILLQIELDKIKITRVPQGQSSLHCNDQKKEKTNFLYKCTLSLPRVCQKVTGFHKKNI